MMGACGFNAARRWLAVWPSLLVMNSVRARTRWDGGSRNVPAQQQAVATKGLLPVNQHHVMPPPCKFQY